MNQTCGKQFGIVVLMVCVLFAIANCGPSSRQRPRRYRNGMPIQNRVKDVTDEEQLIRDLGYILATNRTAVIRFYADWCPVCRNDAPAFERMIQRFPNTIFFKVDVDKHPRLITEYGVRAVPTYFVLRRQTRHLTFHSADDVERALRRR